MVFRSRLCHKYQHAMLRYGSQRLAIFSIWSGVGSTILIFSGLVFLPFLATEPRAVPFLVARFFRYCLYIAMRTPKSPTGRTFGRRSVNIRDIGAVHPPTHFTY